MPYLDKERDQMQSAQTESRKNVSPGSGRPPREGVRVLDLSFFTPGPFASQILADLGATVLKVEAPPQGDRERYIMPSYFKAYNRGKSSIMLNLKEPADL